MKLLCTHPRSSSRLLACALTLMVGCGQFKQNKKADAPSSTLLNSEAASKVSSRQAADVQFTLARTLEQTDRLDEAEQMYRDALKKDPSRADVHGRLAIVCDRKGDFKESSKHFKEAIRLSPKDPELLCDQGYSFTIQRRWADADTSLRKALKIDPRHARSHNNLGLLLAKQGDVEGALAEFSKAGCDPSDARANLGLVLAMEGRLSESQSNYVRAIELKPTSKIAREGLQAAKAASSRPAAVGENQPTAIVSTQPQRDHQLQRTSLEVKDVKKR